MSTAVIKATLPRSAFLMLLLDGLESSSPGVPEPSPPPNRPPLFDDTSLRVSRSASSTKGSQQKQRWLQLLDALTTTTRNTSVFGVKNGDFLTFLVLLSGISFELKLEHTAPPHHLHSMHLKNEYKPRLPCNKTQFSSRIFLEKDVKRKYADFILIFGCQKRERCT